MGLLASGAAHELGTPLSSLSVILGDWRRMPAVAGDTDMAQELEARSEEHTSELQSLMRISYAVFCLKKKNNNHNSAAYRHRNRTTCRIRTTTGQQRDTTHAYHSECLNRRRK